MTAKHFGDRTAWGAFSPRGIGGLSEPGWALPQDPSRYISTDDPYWAQVLQRARRTFGDPNIHYNTDTPGGERRLLFGDGTRLPADGTVVYHNSGTGRDWAQNTDGTTALLDSGGKPGISDPPAGFRRFDDQYAPVDAHGEQVGPLVGGVPDGGSGFHTDPATGMLTPKNTEGDYYTLGSDGAKSFFDKSGAPITEARYRDPGTADVVPAGAGLDTAQQQSGRAADAVNKLHEALHGQYSRISDAEEKFSDVLLAAHATSAAGRDKLDAIQKSIEDAITNPTMSLDTAVGERAFLTFLRDQTAQVNDLVASGALAAADQSAVAQAISALYAADTDTGAASDQPVTSPPPPAPPAAGPDPGAPGSDPGVGDAELGAAPQLPDPSMGGLLDPGVMPGSDAFSPLMSALPGALGGLGGLGSGVSSPLDGLSGLGSALGDVGGRDRGSDSEDAADAGTHDSSGGDKGDKTSPGEGSTPSAPTVQPAGAQSSGQPDASGGSGVAGEPPAPVAAPAGAAAVTLPDGSTATARSGQVAAAVRDYLAGTPVDTAYRQHNIELPPPGTPITNPVDVSKLACGDVAMFKDHYEPVLSAVKGFHNGQVVALGSVSSSPDFLGFFDPLAAAGSAAPASAPPPAGPAGTPPPPSGEPAPGG
jgi:hypothetical protein